MKSGSLWQNGLSPTTPVPWLCVRSTEHWDQTIEFKFQGSSFRAVIWAGLMSLSGPGCPAPWGHCMCAHEPLLWASQVPMGSLMNLGHRATATGGSSELRQGQESENCVISTRGPNRVLCDCQSLSGMELHRLHTS